jgi:hypothetical protein
MDDKFAGVRAGTLVTRSAHWYTQHTSWPRDQLGIVVNRNLYEEDGRLVTYPVIYWEGEIGSSSTHPLNTDVAPSKYRDELEARRTEREAVGARGRRARRTGSRSR